MTDMMLPVESWELTIGKYDPSELIPYGFVLVLLAALKGVKYIAMATDIDHHRGRISKAIDFIEDRRVDYGKDSGPNVTYHANFQINGARAMFIHAPLMPSSNEDLYVKDWGYILANLTAE